MNKQFSLINALSFADGFSSAMNKIDFTHPELRETITQQLVQKAKFLAELADDHNDAAIPDVLADAVILSCLLIADIQDRTPYQVLNLFLDAAGSHWKHDDLIKEVCNENRFY